MNLFVFDIETVPDVEAGRRFYELEGLSDKEVGDVMFHKRLQETGGSTFLRHYQHRVIAISVVLRSDDLLKVWSLGEPDSPEREIIQRFFDGIEKFTPDLISWNGGGFDLPVLHYRALLHGIPAARYWETGDEDAAFRWNNYLNRYHARHTDLMDVLSGYQPRCVAPLNEIATLLGFPGKMGMDGAKVWEHYLQGDIAGIRNYCETDVLNTYLVYLRFELMRGRLDMESYRRECRRLRDTLDRAGKAHLDEFARAWSAEAGA